jgi:hypothetical protein
MTLACKNPACSEVGVAKPTWQSIPLPADAAPVCGTCGQECETTEAEES